MVNNYDKLLFMFQLLLFCFRKSKLIMVLMMATADVQEHE